MYNLLVEICIIGSGHVGLVTGACFADLGNQVVCVDHDKGKIEALKKGRSPFFEPGLEPMVVHNLKRKRLSFTTEISEGVRRSQVIFIAVGTPPLNSGEADLAGVENVCQQIARSMTSYRLIIEKSTVPVETGKWIRRTLASFVRKKVPFDVASNPEFLREGSAVEDFLHPDRIVVGVESARARALLKELYKPFDAPLLVTDIASAELIKHASNASLATKISFINAVAQLCGRVGADVEKVAAGIGMDRRIGPAFLRAGVGYGGFCLDGRQTVLVKRDRGSPFRIALSDLYLSGQRGLGGFRVLSVDPKSFRTHFAPVRAVSRRRYRGRMLTLRTKMNKEVRVTEDHPMLVYRDGTLFTRLAGDLRLGDFLPSFLNYPAAPARVAVDLIEELQKRHDHFPGGVRVRMPRGFLRRHREFTKAALKETGWHRPIQCRMQDVVRNDCLSLEEFLALEKRLPLKSLRDSIRLFTSRGHTTEVPAVWTIDEGLCRFLGYYASEGHIHRELCGRGVRARIVFVFHEEEKGYLSDVACTLDRLGIRFSRRDNPQFHTTSMTCSSRLLAFLLDSVLGCGVNSYDADVPDLVFGLGRACRTAFLEGAYRGDGSVYLPNYSPAVTYDFGTVSQPMAQGVSILLHSIGVIPSSKIGRSRKSSTDCHYRRISGAEQIQRFSWVNEPEKRSLVEQRLAQYRRHIKPTGFQVIQGSGGAIGITKVVAIEAENVVADVYSIEVEGSKTFVTDDGLIVHNCLPKDIEAFIRISEKLGYDFQLLKAVQRINEEQKRLLLKKVEELLWNLKGKRIGVLGLAFKPDTDDLRFAPSLEIISGLVKAGAKVRAFDPQAMAAAKGALNGVRFAEDPYDLAEGADCLVVMTEWNEFKELDLRRVKRLMKQPVLVDGRNLYDPDTMKRLGFRYAGIGRGE
ncbi:MAG: nucleotide sugar dehydrogenase [Candidatus Omnitrophica bacterium]|nr:nucleotide sugar dehydrogenase [Candidatus Omnitrophota bacterium]